MNRRNTHDRVLEQMNKGKEPKGHCQAMTNRINNMQAVTKKELEKDLSKQRGEEIK